MDESLLETVRSRLDEARGRWPQISQATGVPYFTIANIMQGKVSDPRIGTIQKLLDYFNATEKVA